MLHNNNKKSQREKKVIWMVDFRLDRGYHTPFITRQSMKVKKVLFWMLVLPNFKIERTISPL